MSETEKPRKIGEGSLKRAFDAGFNEFTTAMSPFHGSPAATGNTQNFWLDSAAPTALSPESHPTIGDRIASMDITPPDPEQEWG